MHRPRATVVAEAVLVEKTREVIRRVIDFEFHIAVFDQHYKGAYGACAWIVARKESKPLLRGRFSFCAPALSEIYLSGKGCPECFLVEGRC